MPDAGACQVIEVAPMTPALSSSDCMPVCLAAGDQTLLEQAVVGLFILLFLIAVTLNFTGAGGRSRSVGRTFPKTRRQKAMPVRERSWKGLLARCLWELDIVKAYLEETASRYLQSPAAPEAARLTEPVKQSPPVDRRRWTRHPSNLRAICSVASQDFPDTWMASVRDISDGGIGIVAPCKPALGALLDLQLISPNLADLAPLQAEVMFVSQQSAREWVLGCEFLAPLTPQQQELFL